MNSSQRRIRHLARTAVRRAIDAHMVSDRGPFDWHLYDAARDVADENGAHFQNVDDAVVAIVDPNHSAYGCRRA